MKRALIALVLFAMAIGSAFAAFDPTQPYAQAANACGGAFKLQGGVFYDTNNNSLGASLPTCNPPGQTVNVTAGTISGATINATTNSRVDNTTLVATDAFVNQQVLSATATVPLVVTGGTYNFASIGTGLTIAVLTSGGAVSSVVAIIAGGTGYVNGDVVILPMGNSDAAVRVTNASGGVVQSGGAQIIYGGTGYSGSFQTTVVPIPPASRDITLSGVLASNLTMIIPAGTYLSGSRRFMVNNNTTGAFTSTILLSNGAGGTTGTGVVLPQGTSNSSAIYLQTDGQTDIWPAVNAFPSGVTCSGSPTASFATKLGVVTHC